MTYFKSLLTNFLTVFFVNHIIPGVSIAYYSKLPHIGGDIVFSFCLGFVSSLIFPIMRFLSEKPTHFKIGIYSFTITILAYSIVNILPVGIQIVSAGGYIWSVLIVWFVSYLTNHLEFREYLRKKDEEDKKE
jgi:uncharacterized membrane protein YvlD (DUF360 family)